MISISRKDHLWSEIQRLLTTCVFFISQALPRIRLGERGWIKLREEWCHTSALANIPYKVESSLLKELFIRYRIGGHTVSSQNF